MSSLEFIKKQLSEKEFSNLKNAVLNSQKSSISLGKFKFFITRSRIKGEEIVSFISNGGIEFNKKKV